MAPRSKKEEPATQSYEILEPVNFGLKRNDKGFVIPPEEDNREVVGEVEPTPEGEENPTVNLTEKEAAPLLEVGAIKPAGSELPVGTNHSNPEELGYEGEEARKNADPPPEEPEDKG